MKAEQAEKRPQKKDEGKGLNAVSPVISTVIISSTLLIILVIASFVSTNVLEIQLANTEFEQAKTNMLLLDKVIQDVALKGGAVSSVKFSQRSGGIGVYQSEENIRIEASGHWLYPLDTGTPFYIIKYRGGSRVSAAEADLAGSPSLIVDSSESLGHVRVDVENGIWVVLDYLRARVVTNISLRAGGSSYNLTEIFIIRLDLGSASGSGTVTVKVQNMGYRSTIHDLSPGTVVSINVGGRSEHLTITGSNPVLRITEALVRVSIS